MTTFLLLFWGTKALFQSDHPSLGRWLLSLFFLFTIRAILRLNADLLDASVTAECY